MQRKSIYIYTTNVFNAGKAAIFPLSMDPQLYSAQNINDVF